MDARAVVGALVALLVGCSAAGVCLAQARQPGVERHVTGRVLVQPRAGVSLAELDRVVGAHGGRRARAIPRINVHIIELPALANAPAVAQALRRSRHVKFAEVDAVVPPTFLPDDPQYAGSWHLPRISAPAAWDSAQGEGIVIAILDSGVETAHPDLQGQLVRGWNFYDNNDMVEDVHGHGTAMAGIAAAAGNNGVGVASVGLRARIMPLRVTDTSGYGYFSLMASALVHAADNGARVASISFLGVSVSDAVDSAAQYMRSKRGVVVVAGGNTGELRADPRRASLTAVAATDNIDGKTSFSCWGDYIDVAAPGVSIWTTLRGLDYGTVSGTSASTALAAGVYALIASARPDLPSSMLDTALFSTAHDLGEAGYDTSFGHGLVNAANAVAAARAATAGDSMPPTVAITAPSGGAAAGLIAVDVAASDNVGVARVELLANGAVVATDTIAPYAFSLDSSQYSSLTLQARAYDAAGNSAASNMVSLAVANDSTPPMVNILTPSQGTLVSGTVSVSVAAVDNLKVAKLELSIDGARVATSYGGSLIYSWNTTTRGKGRKGPSTLAARAEDAAGNAGTATVTVQRQ